MSFDLVITAKKIITMDEKNPIATWVAINGDKIAAIGNETSVPEGEKILDLTDKIVTTGLIDSHVHAAWTGVLGSSANLLEATSAKKVLDIVAERCNSTKEDLVLAYGYLPMMMEKGILVTKEDLDKISNGKKIMIINVDMHGSTLNTEALNSLDFPKNIEGVNYETGILSSDTAHFIALMGMLEQIDNEKLEEMMDNFVNQALSLGITTVHALEGQTTKSNKDIRIWQRKLDSLPIHMILYPQIWDYEAAKEFNLPRHGGCLTLDGADVQWTMALYEPYNNKSETRGLLYHSDEEVYSLVSKAHTDGKQCSFHAMGDRAIDQILSIYEQVIKEQGDKKLRHRIEHFTLPTDEQIKKAAELGIVVSAQPEYTYLFDVPGGHLLEYFGKERTERMECYKTWIDSGLVFAGGSDAPVNGLNPLSGIHSLVNSTKPGRSMSVTEALKCYTLNCAYAAFEENERGSTEVGKYADFTVLDRDPYLEPEDIVNFKVEMTIVNGKIAYESK